jgi:hypothetical protein
MLLKLWLETAATTGGGRMQQGFARSGFGRLAASVRQIAIATSIRPFDRRFDVTVATAGRQSGEAILLGAIVVIFIVAYTAIALEHPIKINKGASALLGAGLLWTVYAVYGGDHALIGNQLNESVASTARIVFFLIGAMTIVEVIDTHNGFEVVTSLIRTKKQITLMWVVCFVTFFLSAVLDNLTTTIVMISLMKKLSGSQNDRLFFAAMIVIAANAGGAWSVIGDDNHSCSGSHTWPLSRACSCPRWSTCSCRRSSSPICSKEDNRAAKQPRVRTGRYTCSSAI